MMGRISELQKDPAVNTVVVSHVANVLSESFRERYEWLYVKIYEVTMVLTAKGATPESLTLTVPPYMADQFVQNLELKEGKHFIGHLNGRWRVSQDSNLPLDQVEIGSDIGRGVVIAEGFPEAVGAKTLADGLNNCQF